MITFITALLLFILQVTPPVIISGSVRTCLDEPIYNTTVTFSNQGGTTTTDEKGNFSHSLPYGWSGTVSPSKSGGYIFKPSSTTFEKVTTNQTCQFQGGLDPDKDYVLSECDNCPSVSNKDQTDTDSDGFGDLCDIQPQPTLVSPANNAINQLLNLSLVWNPVAEAVTYRVQLSRSSVFDNTLIDDSTITLTSIGIGPLSSGTIHYWRVNEKNAGGTSVWSTTWNFETILSFPDQVVLLSPTNASTIGCDSVKFVWAKASPKVSYYELELVGDSTTVHVSFDTTITLVISSSGTQKNYSWRVRAENSSGFGVYSNAWSFSRLTTDVSEYESHPKEFAIFQNYPNPFNPSTIFSFSLPSRSIVSLKIFDISGKEVATIVSEELPAGNYTRQWYATQFPSGTYFCRLQAGSFIETKKLILLK